MNYKVILNLLGKVSVILAALMVLPLVAALIYGEAIWWTYLATSGIALAVGLPVTLFVKPDNKAIYSREGLVVVSLAWIYASVISTVPLMLSGAIPSFVDALFEMVSGFTTTGATILSADRIDAINATMRSLHLWRAFTHWIGGMGIIVFVMAIVGGAADRSMHILRAEMPGPSVDKIVPRASTTAKILYLIYMGMTLLQIIFLVCGGMSLFDALITSFSTAGTGGFANRSDSVASYNAFCQWVVAVFMLLYGVNFNLYFLMLVRKFRTAFSSRELWLYLGIVIFASTTVCIDVFGKLSFTMSFPDALRHSVYQVAAFITTTGSSTIPSGYDINAFPSYSRAVLLVLMFIGGCAGSTAGGLKVSRVAIMCKVIRKELSKVTHPRSANAVKYEGKVLTAETMAGVTNYFALYMAILAVVFVVISFDPSSLGVEANFSATVSCMNNVGPAYGAVSGGYYMYSDFSKLVLTFAMLIGRLEIYPILLTFSPSTWF